MKKNNLKLARFLTLSLLTLVAFTSFTHNASQETASVLAGINEREQQAIELLRKFLTCPESQVPRWSEFVDQITTLLAGIEEYKGLCESLRKVRNETNPVFGRKRIAEALSPHIMNIKKIPQDIVETFTKMGLIARYNRIKLS